MRRRCANAQQVIGYQRLVRPVGMARCDVRSGRKIRSFGTSSVMPWAAFPARTGLRLLEWRSRSTLNRCAGGECSDVAIKVTPNNHRFRLTLFRHPGGGRHAPSRDWRDRSQEVPDRPNALQPSLREQSRANPFHLIVQTSGSRVARSTTSQKPCVENPYQFLRYSRQCSGSSPPPGPPSGPFRVPPLAPLRAAPPVPF